MKFIKYQGTGNDFIIIDNRGKKNILNDEKIKFLCDRKLGIGADGLMTIENYEKADFKMRYYNSDGKEGTLCGNGSRCIVKCVYDLGMKKKHFLFKAVDGIHCAYVKENDIVEISMNNVDEFYIQGNSLILNTGSPHLVSFKKNIEHFNLNKYAIAIQNMEEYKKQNGINVNIVEIIGNNRINVRTYERGVYAETLSCGTGAVASAIGMAVKNKVKELKTETLINTKGGTLRVKFKKENNKFSEITLSGNAKKVFYGYI